MTEVGMLWDWSVKKSKIIKALELVVGLNLKPLKQIKWASGLIQYVFIKDSSNLCVENQ